MKFKLKEIIKNQNFYKNLKMFKNNIVILNQNREIFTFIKFFVKQFFKNVIFCKKTQNCFCQFVASTIGYCNKKRKKQKY